MLFVSAKLACNPLFSRQIILALPLLNINLKMTGSALVYPVIYILSDAMVLISNRKTAILITLFGIFCDGASSAIFTYASNSNTPNLMSNHELKTSMAFNLITSGMWQLFYTGLIANIVVAVAEIIIFSIIFKKLNNFFFSVTISIVLTLSIHYPLTDYQVLKGEPDAFQIMFHNFIVNVFMALSNFVWVW